MITNMPEMAKILLDKCVTTKGTKDHPASYQVIYDFFCLESIGNWHVIFRNADTRHCMIFTKK